MSSDAAIMLRRNVKHTLRNPVTVFNAILMPIIMMLMFVYVFGGAFNVGGGSYINYATPGMLMLALVYGLSGTAVAVSSDMTKGVMNRFKVMDVSRGAVLTGHVVSTVVRTMVALAAIIGVAFLFGLRPTDRYRTGSRPSACCCWSSSRSAGSPSHSDSPRKPRNPLASPPCR